MIKKKIIILFFLYLCSFSISSCSQKRIIIIKDELSFDLLFNEGFGLSYALLDTLVEKYANHDKDFKKIKEQKLFDPPLDLLVPEPHRIYAKIRTIEQGGPVGGCLLFHEL